MARNKLNTVLRIAYEKDDHETWGHVKSLHGDILPQDKDTLRNMFLLAKTREPNIPMSMRLDARQQLVGRNVITSEDDEPVRPSEKLKKGGAKMLVPGSAKQTLKDNPDIEVFVLVFGSEAARNALMLKWASELQGQLDKVRSNVRYFELYTLDNKHIQFILDDENYDLPITDVAFREVGNVA